MNPTENGFGRRPACGRTSIQTAYGLSGRQNGVPEIVEAKIICALFLRMLESDPSICFIDQEVEDPPCPKRILPIADRPVHGYSCACRGSCHVRPFPDSPLQAQMQALLPAFSPEGTKKSKITSSTSSSIPRTRRARRLVWLAPASF